MKLFTDRAEAGKKLAEQLQEYKNHPDTIVIGLPRGGVIVAYEVAQKLALPLDIIVPRKIGAPSNEELAVGALTQEGDVVWNETIMKSQHLTPEDLADTITKEKAEAQRRISAYRGEREPLKLKHKTVILVDDGIATGATMRAAISSARALGAAAIIAAIPVAPIDIMEQISHEADKYVCLHLAKTLWGVGAFYENFNQTHDYEVIQLLEQADQQ